MSWKDISFSLNLVRSALNHLDFLELVDEQNFSKSDIKKAIYRYEKYWLPLGFKLSTNHQNFKYYPPLDVAWIWQCHLLSPTDYRNDLEKIFGIFKKHIQIPHSCLKISHMLLKQKQTVSLWEKETNLSFEPNQPNTVDASFENFESEFSYDLFEASKRQKSFYYQVLLPHFRSEKFLKAALQRYQKFLCFKKQYPKLSIVPCSAIDIMWHSHQLHPFEYRVDCYQILGRILPHDDSVNDRPEGSKRVTSFCQLWKRVFFNEEFFFPGGMYRGPVPNGSEYKTSDNLNLQEYCDELRSANFRIDHFSLNEKRIFFISLIGTANRELLASNEILTSKFQSNDEIEFDENDTKFILKIRLKENFIEQFLNVVDEGHRSSSKNSIDVDIGLEMAFNQENLIQEKILNLNFHSKKLLGHLKFTIFNVKSKKKLLKFNFVKRNFEEVNMFDLIDEYKSFDLKERIQNEEDMLGLKACHSVTVRNNEIKVYDAEILHVPRLKWSSIRILDNGGCVASAHLIDSSQLPSPHQVELSFFSLDSKSERALLVRDLKGDFAVIKASWLEKKPISLNEDETIGCLDVTLMELCNKTQVKFNVDVLSDDRLKLILSGSKVEISLRNGNVNLTIIENVNNVDVERVLCIALGLCLLHVFLQPKPYITIDKSRLKFEEDLVSYPRYTDHIKSIDSKKFTLLDIIGYHDLIKHKHFIDMGFSRNRRSNFYGWIHLKIWQINTDSNLIRSLKLNVDALNPYESACVGSNTYSPKRLGGYSSRYSNRYSSNYSSGYSGGYSDGYSGGCSIGGFGYSGGCNSGGGGGGGCDGGGGGGGGGGCDGGGGGGGGGDSGGCC